MIQLETTILLRMSGLLIMISEVKRAYKWRTSAYCTFELEELRRFGVCYDYTCSTRGFAFWKSPRYRDKYFFKNIKNRQLRRNQGRGNY